MLNKQLRDSGGLALAFRKLPADASNQVPLDLDLNNVHKDCSCEYYNIADSSGTPLQHNLTLTI